MSGSWRDEFAPGDIAEGVVWNTASDVATGIVMRGDDNDDSLLITGPQSEPQHNPEGDAWDFEWIKTSSAKKIDPEGGSAQYLRRASPLSSPTPEYIFMVIRPQRKITTYASLDALVEGMFKEGEPVSAERQQHLREAAAQAVADPETDIKVPPGASNSPWLRFTQVEGV